MNESISISKRLFFALCGLLAILFAILVTGLLTAKEGNSEQTPNSEITVDRARSAWIQDGNDFEIPPEFQKQLMGDGVYSILLFREDGQFRWLDIDGEEIPICGEIVNGRIFDEKCGLKDKKFSFTTLTEFSVLGLSYNPKCKLGKHQGKLAMIHSKKSGHSFPCH